MSLKLQILGVTLQSVVVIQLVVQTVLMRRGNQHAATANALAVHAIEMAQEAEARASSHSGVLGFRMDGATGCGGCECDGEEECDD